MLLAGRFLCTNQYQPFPNYCGSWAEYCCLLRKTKGRLFNAYSCGCSLSTEWMEGQNQVLAASPVSHWRQKSPTVCQRGLPGLILPAWDMTPQILMRLLSEMGNLEIFIWNVCRKKLSGCIQVEVGRRIEPFCFYGFHPQQLLLASLPKTSKEQNFFLMTRNFCQAILFIWLCFSQAFFSRAKLLFEDK